MSVKLRLTRKGKTKQPTYRIVAADSRSKRDGAFIEILGTYEPLQNPSRIVLGDTTKIINYLQQGAQPTETVEKILKIEGVWEQFQAAKVELSTAAKAAAKK